MGYTAPWQIYRRPEKMRPTPVKLESAEQLKNNSELMDFIFSVMNNLFERDAGVALNFVDEGSGSPVLLIHGVGSDLHSWDGVLSSLEPGRRYIRFDLRGHGKSRRTQGSYELADFVADAMALLDHLGVTSVTVVGFSLGGLIAQAIALAHPDRVAALCLVSTVAGRTEQEKERVKARALTLANEGAEAHLANAVNRWFTDEFVAAHPEVLEARRQKSLQNDPDSYVTAYQVLAGNDLGDQLAKISVPTMVVTGENDIGSSPRMAKFIHEQISGSELHIMPRLKHSVLLEAPADVAFLIESFLHH